MPTCLSSAASAQRFPGDDKIEKVLAGMDAGIGVRLVVGSMTAFAFSNDFSRGT
jgi:predicted Zn-dependent protease